MVISHVRLMARVAATLAIAAASPLAAQDANDVNAPVASGEQEDAAPPPPMAVTLDQPSRNKPASDTLVRASDPQSVMTVLKASGRTAELGEDSIGDPRIETDFGGYIGYILFYDCDPDTNDACSSLQFSVGLDRENPMPLAMVSDLASKWRFVSIHLDSEGDPYMQWDILTGEGINAAIFYEALDRYSDTIEIIANDVFAEERELDSILEFPEQSAT